MSNSRQWADSNRNLWHLILGLKTNRSVFMKIKKSKTPGRLAIELDERDETLLARSTGPELLKIKRILVPTDFSECSQKALQYAAAFAKQFGAALDVVHVVVPRYGVEGYSDFEFKRIRGEMKAEDERKLSDLIDEHIPRVEATGAVRIGSPPNEIVAAAKELESDLIIISTHGHTGFKHMFLGSTAEAVVRQAPCPVLVVREREHEFIRS